MTKTSSIQNSGKKSIKPSSRRDVLSLFKTRKEKVNLSKNKTLINNNKLLLPKKAKGPRPSGIADIDFGKIVDTVKDVVTTGTRVIAGDPTSLLTVPNTILKVVDTAQSTVKALSKDNAPKVVVDRVDVGHLQNQKVIERLKQSVPVINTTNVPSVYSSEIDLPPLKTSERFINGQKVFNVTGTSMISGAMIFAATDPLMFYKTYSALINPVDAIFFGPRVQQIASQFQKWRLNQIVANYIPTVGTQISGQVHLTFTNGTTPTDVASSKTDIAQREHYKPASVFNQCQLGMRGTESFLWCSRISEPTEQIKFFAQQQFEVWCDGNNRITWDKPFGNILLTFDIDFMHAMEYPYSFFSSQERRLQGHWISNYIMLQYTDHMKFLRFLTNKMISEICNEDLFKLGNVQIEQLLDRPYTSFKISCIRQKLRSYFNKLIENNLVNTVKETQNSNEFSYLSEVIKLVKDKYFFWIFHFVTEGTLENALTRYSISRDGNTISELAVYLLDDFGRIVRTCIDKLTVEEFDFDDELDNFQHVSIDSDVDSDFEEILQTTTKEDKEENRVHPKDVDAKIDEIHQNVDVYNDHFKQRFPIYTSKK